MTAPHIPDDDLERDRATVSAAYAAARVPHAGPPPAIDDAIRAAARRAVGAGPRPANRPWLARWSKPLSVAAVVVLSASVIFMAVEEDSSLKVGPAKKPMESRFAESAAVKVLDSPGLPVSSDTAALSQASNAPQSPVVGRDKTPARSNEAVPPRVDSTASAPVVVAEMKRPAAAPASPEQSAVSRDNPATLTDRRSSDAAFASPPTRASASPPPAAASAARPPVIVAAAPQPPPQAAAAPAPRALAPAMAGLAKEKALSRAEARANADAAQQQIAEGKAEGIAASQARAEPGLSARSKTPAEAGAIAVSPLQGAPAAKLSDRADTPDQAYARLRELRAKAAWKEFDALLIETRKRWPEDTLPADLAETQRERARVRSDAPK